MGDPVTRYEQYIAEAVLEPETQNNVAHKSDIRESLRIYEASREYGSARGRQSLCITSSIFIYLLFFTLLMISCLSLL